MLEEFQVGNQWLFGFRKKMINNICNLFCILKIVLEKNWKNAVGYLKSSSSIINYSEFIRKLKVGATRNGKNKYKNLYQTPLFLPLEVSDQLITFLGTILMFNKGGMVLPI